MKILYFHQHFSTPRGTTATRSYQFAKKLIGHGHQVTMVCGSYAGGDTGLKENFTKGIREGDVDGIRVVEIELLYSNYDSFFKRSLIFIKFALKSIKIALIFKYDLLFATSTPLTASIPGIFAKLFRHKKFIFEVRDLWPELPREMGVISNPIVLCGMSILEWLSYNLADACIGLSPGICKGIKRRIRNEKKIIEMLPNGCDLDLFKPLETSDKTFFEENIKGYRNGDFVALFTGAHGVANGLDAVLDAANELVKRKATNIKLIFIGDGKLKPHLLKRTKKERLKNCFFLDPVLKLELAKIVPCADVGLMILDDIPAFYYGTSPNKFFDFISSGLPVLNNYPGWLADIIIKNECGHVVAPNDPVIFAKALIETVSDRKKLLIMGKNARKLAVSQFDRNDIAKRFVKLIERIYGFNN
jgi:glycosyltransferase involved in cell wall biosynthesis